MDFRYGFEIESRKYGWFRRKLYRLPYSKNGTDYAMRQIMPGRIGKTTVYSIAGRKRTIGNLKAITVPVKWKANNFKHRDIP